MDEHMLMYATSIGLLARQKPPKLDERSFDIGGR